MEPVSSLLKTCVFVFFSAFVCLFVCLLCCFVCCVTTCKNITLSYFLTSDASFYRMDWIAILMINYKLI